MALPHIQPNCFDDLITTISLIRPGPVQGNMVKPLPPPLGTGTGHLSASAAATGAGGIAGHHPVSRAGNQNPATWPDSPAAKRNCCAVPWARKMPTRRLPAARAVCGRGRRKRGFRRHCPHRQIFDQLTAFGGYSFAKSHAAAFAVLVTNLRLRCYHPRAILCRAAQPPADGFWIACRSGR